MTQTNIKVRLDKKRNFLLVMSRFNTRTQRTSLTSDRQRKNYANENGKPSDLSPSCPKSLLTWNCLGRQSRSA